MNQVISSGQPWEVKPEWVRPTPHGWEESLRGISPIVDRTSHLRFRWRANVEQWELYECTPLHLIDPDRVKQLSVHWSQLPKDQQRGRRTFVTEYQHYMYREHKVDARRFWVLQGNRGGTPAAYTERERRMLEIMGECPDVPPLGCLPYAPFDGRAIKAIQQRDRLAKHGYDIDALEKAKTAESLRIEDEEAEKDYRRAFLSWWSNEMKPMSEFMKWYLGKSESDHTLRRATRDEANAVSQWKDHFIETGVVLNAGQVSNRALQIAVR